MALSHPTLDAGTAEHIYYIDMVCSVLFLCEMALKVSSTGFVLGRGTYLRSSWNQLDFFCCLVSLIDLLPLQVGLQGITRLSF